MDSQQEEGGMDKDGDRTMSTNVPCPTCGVRVGERCVRLRWSSLERGGIAISPHPERVKAALAEG